MAVDYGILTRTPSVGERYMEGLQMRQADAERNMLRQSQMQQMQLAQSRFKQEQEDRAYQLGERKKQAEREAQFQSVANLIRERGLDPDDPKVLGQFAEAALKAENPQLVSFVGQMAERAAKRRAAKEEASTIGDILSPRLPPGPPLRQEAAAPNALAAPVPAVNALAAPQQPQNLFAGTPFDIGMGMPAPAKAAAPMAAPAAAPVATGNAALIGQLESQRDALERYGSPRALAEAKFIQRRIDKLQPKEAKEFAPPELVRLQDRLAELPEGDPRRKSLEQRIGVLTTKPEGTKVVVPPQEKAEQGKRGELLVEQYKAVSNAARTAQRTLPSLETQASLLDQGFKTGFGTDVQKVGASFLGALGVPEAAKFATNAQTFLAASQDAVLAKQLEQKGAQSDRDSQRITETGTQLGNTPEANRFIIDVAKAQLKRDIAQRNFYDDWWKKNKTYDGAEDAWSTGEGNKSLFDLPELRKYAAPAKPAAAPAPSPAITGIKPYTDAEKERRYQEWKRKQGAQ